MKRLTLLLIAGSVPALTACLPMMAISAADMVVRSTQKPPVSNEALRPQAQEQCMAQAAQYGTVHLIDVEQHGIAKIIVWGTVADTKQKRSFECDFTTKITDFKLRAITP